MFVYYKCYISIELTFLKELMLIKQVYQKSVYLSLLVWCYDLSMMSMNLRDIAFLNIKDSDHCCIIPEAINLIQNTDLTEKTGTL